MSCAQHLHLPAERGMAVVCTVQTPALLMANCDNNSIATMRTGMRKPAYFQAWSCHHPSKSTPYSTAGKSQLDADAQPDVVLGRDVVKVEKPTFVKSGLFSWAATACPVRLWPSGRRRWTSKCRMRCRGASTSTSTHDSSSGPPWSELGR